MIPANLSECFDELDNIFQDSPTDYENFKMSSEDEAIIILHFGLGKWIRNNWGLWTKNTNIYHTLHAMQLWHAEDMSTVILTAYHRYINNQPLGLKEQVQFFLEYWKDYEQHKGPIHKQ